MSGLAFRRRAALALLLAAACLAYPVNIGVSSIWDANEAFYAQTPREMIEAGDYVTPTFNFQLRVNKPVLSYWHVALSYHAFGVSEWSERLPIALAGLAIIGASFALGRLAGGTSAGLVAALVVAASPRMLLLARRIIIDVHITMWMALILLFFALSEVRPERRTRYLVAMYVTAGFGVLTKGPVAVFLPGLVFLVYLAVERRLGDLRRMMLPLGAAISLSIVVPWYVLLFREHGWAHIGTFIFGENLGRYAAAVGEQSRGFWFYLPVMLADLFPWSFVIPLSLWWAVRERKGDRVCTLLVVWVAVIVVFFSFSGTKEDLYVLPIVPAEAALIGAFLATAIDGHSGRPALWWGTGLTGLLLGIGGLLVVWLFVVNPTYPLAGASAIGVVAILAGAAAAVAAFRRQVSGAVMATLAGLVIITWVIVTVALADFERYKPVRPFTEVIAARASPAAVVGSYRFALPSMVFYLNRPVMEIVVPEHLRAAFRSAADVYFVMPEEEYHNVRADLPVATYVLARRPMFDLKPRNFLEGTELPQFVLVSNRE